jgi:hypothetical protein
MAIPHYMYLVLKMLGPNGIIIVKGSFELSDQCDKKFHQMAQNFGMIANYGEPKGKAASATTGITEELEGHPAELEVKKNYGYSHQTQRKLQWKNRIPPQHRQQAYGKG